MTVRVGLTMGKFALIDDEDAEKVLGTEHAWKAKRDRRKHRPDVFYALRRRSQSSTHISMHRLVLDAPVHLQVDHINGDGLDNRKANLRLATEHQNSAHKIGKLPGTSSQYRGVTWHKQAKRWQAAIQVRRKKIYLGLFVNETEAAGAYDHAAKAHFGEFAVLNEVKR
jgi:hypothetical protein